MALPAGSGRGLRTGQARSELQQVCQRHNWVTPKEWPHTRVGPPHEPVYTCYVSVRPRRVLTRPPDGRAPRADSFPAVALSNRSLCRPR